MQSHTSTSTLTTWAKKHPILTGIIGLLVIIFIRNLFSTDTKSPTPAPITAQSSYEDKIKALAVKTGSTNISYVGIDDQEADSDKGAGSRMITIKLNITDFYSKSSLLRDTGTVTAKLFQETFASQPKASDVVVWFYIDTTNKYGNKANTVALSEAMDRKTYQKINWQNFDTTKLCDFLKSEGETNDSQTVCALRAFVK